MPSSTVGDLLNLRVTLTGEFIAGRGTRFANCRFGRPPETLKIMPRLSEGKWTIAPEQERLPMTSEFYLMLSDRDLSQALENAVFEAGFDDSELTIRGDHAAIWVCHRSGDLTSLVREALLQAQSSGIQVSHVEIENAVFA